MVMMMMMTTTTTVMMMTLQSNFNRNLLQLKLYTHVPSLCVGSRENTEIINLNDVLQMVV